MYSEEYERAYKAYLRNKRRYNHLALRARAIPRPMNREGRPEFRLYGYTWIAHEFPSISGRKFLISFATRYEFALNLVREE